MARSGLLIDDSQFEYSVTAGSETLLAHNHHYTQANNGTNAWIALNPLAR